MPIFGFGGRAFDSSSASSDLLLFRSRIRFDFSSIPGGWPRLNSENTFGWPIPAGFAGVESFFCPFLISISYLVASGCPVTGL